MNTEKTTAPIETTEIQMSRAMTLMQNGAAYRYKITRQQHGTDRFGVCEVCNQTASVVYHQVEQRRYTKSNGQAHGWTEKDCHNLFGHLDCLSSRRMFTKGNQIAQTGMTVKTPRGRNHTIEALGTELTTDVALVREAHPGLYGHAPAEYWIPLDALRVVR